MVIFARVLQSQCKAKPSSLWVCYKNFVAYFCSFMCGPSSCNLNEDYGVWYGG